MKRRVLRAVSVCMVAGALVVGSQSITVLAKDKVSAAETDGVSRESLVGKWIFAQCDDYINIHRKPRADSKVTAKIYNNGSAKVVCVRSDGWLGIKSGNAIGYVKADYFVGGKKAKNIANEVAYNVAIVKTDELSIRSEASEDSVVLDCAQTGDELEIVENDGDWLKVARGDDLYGYVNASYVKCKTYYPVAKTLEELGEEEEAEAEAEAEAEPEVEPETAPEVEAVDTEYEEPAEEITEEEPVYEEPVEEELIDEEPVTEAEEPVYEEEEEVEEDSSYEEAAYEEIPYEETTYEEVSYEDASYEEEETSYEEPSYEETTAYTDTSADTSTTASYTETSTAKETSTTEVYTVTSNTKTVTATDTKESSNTKTASSTETKSATAETTAETASSDATDFSSEIGVTYDSTYNGDDYYYNADEDAYYFGSTLLSYNPFTESEDAEEESADDTDDTADTADAAE